MRLSGAVKSTKCIHNTTIVVIRWSSNSAPIHPPSRDARLGEEMEARISIKYYTAREDYSP